ncbi:MAG: lysylphosphatidylglycerol synthase transmembrane domain-containing protein [Polyangiaceae bacterium]
MSDEPKKNTSSQGWAGRVFRTLVSVGLIALLVYKVPLDGVGLALRSMPLSGVVLALLVMVVQLVVGVARWRRMLARVGENVPLGVLITDTLVGSAYALLVPTIGSDVVRAQRCGKRLSRPHRAWSTVLFERLVGMLSLAAVSVPGIAVVPEGRALIAPTLILVLVCIVVLMVAKAPLRFAARLLLSRAPGLASIGEGIAEDLEGPLATVGARFEALAWSVGYQLAGLSILTACVIPQGDASLVLAIYAGLPLIAIGMMVPVSLGGMGQREGLFVLILGLLGVERPTALALSLLWLGSYVVLAVAGVIVMLVERGPQQGEKNHA